MSGLVGLDMNGLWDWAAFKETESGDPSFRDGGVNGAAIRLTRYPATFVVGRKQCWLRTDVDRDGAHSAIRTCE